MRLLGSGVVLFMTKVPRSNSLVAVVNDDEWYCWWKKSCTTWNVYSINLVNNGINYLPTGAGFQPSTVVEHDLFVWYFFDPGADNLHDLCQIENFMSLTLPCGLKGALVGSVGATKLQDKKKAVGGRLYLYLDICNTILPFYVYERKGHIKWQLILKKTAFAMRCWFCFGTGPPLWILEGSIYFMEHNINLRNLASEHVSCLPSRHAMIWIAI